MIAKLEWTQSNAQQNIEQLQSSTIGVTLKNESKTTKAFLINLFITKFIPYSVYTMYIYVQF